MNFATTPTYRASTILVFALAACSRSVSPPPEDPSPPPPASTPETVQRHCTAWATIVDGSKLFSNNVFNEAKANGPHEQCLLERQVAGNRELGWSWQWPGFEAGSFGYPEIIFGKKPWETATTDPSLPQRIGDLAALVVEYRLQTEGTGSHPLTLGIWLTTSGAVDRPTWAEIAGEVAIWLDFTSDASPEGTNIGSLDVDGTSYALWLDEVHGDRGDGQGWRYYTLKGPKLGADARLQVHSVLRAMVDAGYWEESLYVSSVELGNEVRSGTGSTWVKHHRVEVEITPKTP